MPFMQATEDRGSSSACISDDAYSLSGTSTLITSALALVRFGETAMFTMHQVRSRLLGIPARSNIHQHGDNG